ncbi:conserved hypothetical protein [Ignisphaera aggregans DSM 17230]|uniref:LOG family protein n=1 Tax=Ignisphaera aggregans (strain DSM 17230 / JCM 13409 / AQ1.S1) TaxID=583356 RepID=E0SNN0_IGNAA|nr:conserved hypothetical protein [Ignisphaera aggregans DSM 17230]
MKQIAVAGYSGDIDISHRRSVERFIELIKNMCSKNIVLLLGGYWGVMKIVVDKAVELGLPVVLFLPIEEEDVRVPENVIVIKSGLSYRLRSVAMVRSANAVVVLGGASGTIQEAVTAYTEGKPVFVLKTGLDSDKLQYLSPYIDNRLLSKIEIFENVEDLVQNLCKTLSD